MANLVKLEALEELGLEQPNMLHIQESYLRQVANGKPFTARKKNKHEVAGSGAKIYRQKGTGRARQGERMNPHFRGGAMAFALRPRHHLKRMNKITRRSALRSAVLTHIMRGSAWVIQGSDFDGFDKTKLVAGILAGVQGRVCLIVNQDVVAYRSSRNIGAVRLLSPERINVRDLVESGNVIFAESALQQYKSLLELQNAPEDFDAEAFEAGGEE
ncbi:50S ribosomal protein L4 [bacterium]|nr:50S ribosomal protein L4 [bacterium]